MQFGESKQPLPFAILSGASRAERHGASLSAPLVLFPLTLPTKPNNLKSLFIGENQDPPSASHQSWLAS